MVLESTVAYAIVFWQSRSMRQEENGNCLVAEPPLALAARLGAEGCAALEANYRSGMGQFLTPPGVAGLLAGMFESAVGDVRLLDAGAGVGTLTAAFVEDVLGREQKPSSLHLTAWEAEKEFVGRLRQVLEECVEAGRAAGVPTSYVLNHGDMLKDGAALLDEDDLFRGPRQRRDFTHAIMNPPYRKINADSEARSLLRRAGLETSNLYTGFLWLVARLLEREGQMVAITPRSFCNGPYFLPFRERFFGLMALERLHVFNRRDALFAGDDVLQENLIMYARRSAKRRTSVMLTSSDGLPAEVARSRTVPYARVMDPADSGRVVHLALDVADDDVKRSVMGLPASLVGLGIEVSTGRVVDFRARDFLRKNAGEHTVPLIYPMHFNGGGVHWPCPGSRKANALLAVPETEELLIPNGVYVLVKRFTAKEERRRIVATVFRPEGNLAGFRSVGFENHLNYFHRMGWPLDRALAEGLALYLNSTVVDSYFRQFSGHTQVNATDLRSLRYPSKEQLCRLAAGVEAGARDQEAIDAAVDGMIRTSRR
jgi:adenine-specific DNA-methyltransferase